MKLESQVVSLEISKRLRELGVKQESHFIWSEHTEPETLWCINAIGDEKYPAYSAFTVAELGEMLPDYDEWTTLSTPDNPPEGDSNGIKTIHYKIGNYWYSEIDSETYIEGFDFYDQGTFKASTEADARAKMLIYLIENKLITV